MRVRCEMVFPGEIVEAVLTEMPSMMLRNATETRLELVGDAPVLLEPPDACGTVLVEATPAELEALEAAGFKLKRAT